MRVIKSLPTRTLLMAVAGLIGLSPLVQLRQAQARPTVTFTSPQNGDTVQNLESSGTANDANVTTPVTKVEMTIQYVNNPNDPSNFREGLYWNGSQWVGPPSALPPAAVDVGAFHSGHVPQFEYATGNRRRNFPSGLSLPESVIYGPDLTSDGYPDLFIAERGRDRVVMYDGYTGLFSRVFVAGGVNADETDINPGGLLSPTGLVFGPDFNGDSIQDLYVSSGNRTGTNNVKVYDGTTGTFLADYTKEGQAPSDNAPTDDGNGNPLDYRPGGGVIRNGIEGITFDVAGNLYMTALSEHKIVKYNRATDTYTDFVPAGSSGLLLPTDVLFAPNGNLYVLSSRTDDVKVYDGTTGAPVIVRPGAPLANDQNNLVDDTDGTVTGLNGPERMVIADVAPIGTDVNGKIKYGDGTPELYVTSFLDLTTPAAKEEGTSVLRYNALTGASMPRITPPANSTKPNNAVFITATSGDPVATNTFKGAAGLAINPVALGFTNIFPPRLPTDFDPTTGVWTKTTGLPQPGPDLLEGDYRLTAIATNSAGEETSTTITVTVEYPDPSVEILFPLDGSYRNNITEVNGTATDSGGGNNIDRVELAIQNLDDLTYWDGFRWVRATNLNDPPRLPTIYDPDTQTWSVTTGLPTPNDLSNSDYALTAYAYHTAAFDPLVQRGTATNTIIIDLSPPRVSFRSFTPPAAPQPYPNTVNTDPDIAQSNVVPVSSFSTGRGINGFVTDRVFQFGSNSFYTGSGVARVDLFIQRFDGLFWNGTDWVNVRFPLETALTPNLDESTATWSRTTGLPTGSKLLDGFYTLSAVAYDKVNNSGSVTPGAYPATITVQVDQTPPRSVTFTSPADATPTIPADGPFVKSLASRGTASDNPPTTANPSGGSGIQRVELVIQRSDGKYWNPQTKTWVTATSPDVAPSVPTLLSTGQSGISNWTAEANLPNGPQGTLHSGVYTLFARAFDKAGNVTQTSMAVTVDLTPPTVAFTSHTNNQGVSNLNSVSGTTSDPAGRKFNGDPVPGTGVIRVELYIKRYDNLYWTGSRWGGRTALVTTLSGNTWTRNFAMPTPLSNGNYTLEAIAYDRAGNTGSNSITVVVGSPTVQTSPATLSSRTASAAGRNIKLNFSIPLDPNYARDPSRYLVKVEGQTIGISSITYTAATNTVTLNLPAGALVQGYRVHVTWSNLRDTQGRSFSGQTGQDGTFRTGP